MGSAGTTGEVRVIRCFVGERTYALEMEGVQTVERPDRLLPASDAAQDGRVGLLRTPAGELPVYSLAQRLGLTDPTAVHAPYVVVIKSATQPWGLQVDRVSQVCAVATSQIHPVPALVTGTVAHPFRAVLDVDDQLVFLLAPDGVRHVEHVVREQHSLPPAGPSTTATVAEPMAVNQRVIVFRTHDAAAGQRQLNFVLNLAAIQEIVDLPLSIPVAMAPEHVLGVARWRDRPIALVDLARWLGLPPTPQEKGSRLLVLPTRTAGWVGIVVRPHIRIVRLPLRHRAWKGALPLNPARVRGAVQAGDEILAVPDLTGIR